MPDIKLKKNQWGRISDILGNMGLVFLTSVVIPFIIDSGSMTFPVLLSGLVLFFGCIIGSVIIERKT